MKSRIDSKYLAQIWELSDLDKDGRLTELEFSLGLYYIDYLLGLAQVNVPFSLPEQTPPYIVQFFSSF